MAHRSCFRWLTSLVAMCCGAGWVVAQPQTPPPPAFVPPPTSQPTFLSTPRVHPPLNLPSAPLVSVDFPRLPPTPSVEPIVVKEFVTKDRDASFETLFGKGSAETRRPIRIWFGGDRGIAFAAQDVTIVGTTLRFTDLSVGFAAGSEVLRSDGGIATVALSTWAPTIDELNATHLRSMELPTKDATIVVGILNPTPITPPRLSSEPQRLVAAAKHQLLGQRFADGTEVSYRFPIDPAAPVASLLPTAPKAQKSVPFNEDLRKVPELSLTEPAAKSTTKQEATQTLAGTIARVNHLNVKKSDGFLLAMLDRRADLRGVPFLMGEECRTRDEQARLFATFADGVQQLLRDSKAAEDGEKASASKFWAQINNANVALQSQEIEIGKARVRTINAEAAHRALVAALVQIMMPEAEFYRIGLARYLATVPHADATKALARLAIFSSEEDVRTAALEGLKLRRERDYTDVLLQGFHYPLPAVARRSAEALVKLDRKDLLADLVDVLDQPDPRLPVVEKRDGQETTVVRELVKINHHRNCLLCHAPGNTDNVPDGVLKVAIPLPTEPFAKPAEGGGYQKVTPLMPDTIVRLDMTYLRQDFSLMMPVADSHPWPDMQRFDFLVRTRPVTPDEAATYRDKETAEDGRISAYHRAALFALRELSGRDAEPSAQAWRKLLKLRRT